MPTSFTQSVLKAIQRIPAGKVATYRQVALAVGKPAAVRAVGNALHSNPDAPVVPCHRVVRSDGSLGGYAFGSRRKIALLADEGVPVVGGKVDLQRYNFSFSHKEI
jgi:O-6-methylguanine DNA methyltransferase